MGRASSDISSYDIGLRMVNAIAHRGPNSIGVLEIGEDRLVLAHRRLSVIDTSDAGSQPMVSASGRFTIVYNGEIYNHLDLRSALDREGSAPDWRGNSDTETILACFEVWGIDATLSRLNGMFAFAVWDRQSACLTLARDRMGEKPLYYGTIGGVFLFGSELKALQSYPGFEAAINRDALTAFVQRSYVPGPYSIYKDVSKLQPGQVIRVNWRNDVATKPDIKNRYLLELEECNKGWESYAF